MKFTRCNSLLIQIVECIAKLVHVQRYRLFFITVKLANYNPLCPRILARLEKSPPLSVTLIEAEDVGHLTAVEESIEPVESLQPLAAHKPVKHEVVDDTFDQGCFLIF